MSGTQRTPATKYERFSVPGCRMQAVQRRNPLWYKRDPEDKNHLLIDEEAAKVVRRIYQMVIDGMGSQAIANQLTADNVLIPLHIWSSPNMEKAVITATMTPAAGTVPQYPTFWTNRNIWGIRFWARPSARTSKPRNAGKQDQMS